ncbi:glutamate synthase-related protein [Nitrospinaceae bacterium]|nr:glutamate synthase-related protein [Nitrospinaceae bacterium]
MDCDRACHANNCPVGIATQKEHLRKRLIIDESAARLENFFGASVELMKVLSRACSHSHLNEFELSDLQRANKKCQTWQVSLLPG